MKTQKTMSKLLAEGIFLLVLSIILAFLSFSLNAQTLVVNPSNTTINNFGDGYADMFDNGTPPFVSGNNSTNFFSPNLGGADLFAYSERRMGDPGLHKPSHAQFQNFSVVRIFNRLNQVSVKWQNSVRTHAVDCGYLAHGRNHLDFTVSMKVLPDSLYNIGDTIRVYYTYGIYSTLLCFPENSPAEDMAHNVSEFYVDGVEQLNDTLEIHSPPKTLEFLKFSKGGYIDAIIGQSFTTQAISTISDTIQLSLPASGEDRAYTEFFGNIIFYLEQDSRTEFSLDIGSDSEISDPNSGNNGLFDPGDAYVLGGSPLSPPGQNGVNDDYSIFGSDPSPVPGNMTSAAPCGQGLPLNPADYFDLDGMDNIKTSLDSLRSFGLGMPSIPAFDDRLIHIAQNFIISFDDDDAENYTSTGGSVPVNSFSPDMNTTYGKAAERDEVIAYDLNPFVMPTTGYTTGCLYNEKVVHESLTPNPDAHETYDDDVDALDYFWDQYQEGLYYFSPDHEATSVTAGGSPLNGGSIYLSKGPLNLKEVINGKNDLGLLEGTDIDAFEFGWVWDTTLIPSDTIPRGLSFALLFSVDDDDPLTVGVDESGGLSPAVIYYSFLNGHSYEFSDTLRDDIDAIALCDHSYNGWVNMSCDCPTGLSATNITDVSAELSWTPGGSETSWNIEYGPAGFTLGTGTLISGIGNPYLLSGLAPNTAYDFYVQADCGGGSSSNWAGPLTFATLQPMYALPFSEDFSACTFPNDWIQTSTVNSAFWTITNSNFAGGSACEMQAQFTQGTGTSRLISPPINTSGINNLKLKFLTQYLDWGVGAILYVQSSNDGINWIDEWAYASGSGNISPKTIDLTIMNNLGATTYLAWVVEGDHYQIDFWYVDDVNIYENTSCLPPTALTVAISSATTAELTWVSGGSATSWNIEYGPAGFSLGSGTIISGVSNPHLLVGLTSSTTYDFYVQANCGGGNTSVWSAPCTFKTLACQTLGIPQGWSGISTWLHPQSPGVSNMFAPVASDVEYLFSIGGLYWPALNINSIGNWNPYEGYIVKVLNNVTLQVCGTPVSSTSVNLSAGWNLIPVLSSVDVDIVATLGTLSCFVIAKGIPTGIYWPTYGNNNIYVLEPGKAYWVYVTCDCTLTYPPSPMKASASSPVIVPPVISPWNDVYRTANSHLIAIDDEFAGQNYGKIIGVFNNAGECMGLAEMGKDNNVLIVYGDDPSTTEIDGMMDGGEMTFKIYDPISKTESILMPEFDTSLPEWTNEFKTNGLSRISYKTSVGEVLDDLSISIYPNPASDVVNITVNDSRNSVMQIKIVDVAGRVLLTEKHSTVGQVTLNIAHLPRGFYQLTIQFPEKPYTYKLVIN